MLDTPYLSQGHKLIIQEWNMSGLLSLTTEVMGQEQINLGFLFMLLYYSISITYIVFNSAISLGSFTPLLEKQSMVVYKEL